MADLNALMQAFKETIAQILPLSPFRAIINSWETNVPIGIRWLNWFVPVSGILQLLMAWLAAYVLYLLASIILRWIKAIK